MADWLAAWVREWIDSINVNGQKRTIILLTGAEKKSHLYIKKYKDNDKEWIYNVKNIHIITVPVQ